MMTEIILIFFGVFGLIFIFKLFNNIGDNPKSNKPKQNKIKIRCKTCSSAVYVYNDKIKRDE